MDNIIIERIKTLAKEKEHELIKCRRDLHKYPETGWTEFRTSSIAQKRMAELGYTITMGDKANNKDYMMGVPSEKILKENQQRAVSQGADAALVEKMTHGYTGFWADMKFSDDGPYLAFRFDMDSNDVTETADENHRPNKENFSSVNNGAMHACGHDAHVSLGLAAAEIIANIKDSLKGSIRFIFQPAEEGLRGAMPMIKAGACNGITHIIGIHIGFQANDSHTIICGADKFLASTKFDVTFQGKQAHAGAYPEDGRNALLAACNAALNLHAVSRNGKGATRINVGRLTAGEGRNIIPAKAELIMETRCETSQLNEYMVEESRRIIEASALMEGCSYTIKTAGGSSSGQSSREMIEYVKEAVKYVPEYKKVIENVSFGAGEDYASIMSCVQENGGIGTYIQAGIDRYAGHHNDYFDFDEKNLVPALNTAAISAYLILKK